jgi:hypothetical protein
MSARISIRDGMLALLIIGVCAKLRVQALDENGLGCLFLIYPILTSNRRGAPNFLPSFQEAQI